MAHWYCGSTKYAAVTAWAALTTVSVGAIRRQLATPAVNSERCFRVSAITTGITGATEPSWNTGANATTTDAGVTWTECTGQAIYNGDGGGSAWAAPFARVYTAFQSGYMSALDILYVSNNHAATQASSISFGNGPGGNTVQPVQIICVVDTAVPPTATATTAKESTTGGNDITMSLQNSYWYGIGFSAGDGANTANLFTQSYWAYYDNCTFTLNNTSTGSVISPSSSSSGAGYDAADITHNNCTFVFGSTAQTFGANNLYDANFIGGSFFKTGSVPVTMFNIGYFTNRGVTLALRDCDLSTVTGTLLEAAGIGMVYGNFSLENCKLGSGVLITDFSNVGGNTGLYGFYSKAHNCDSGATNYHYYYQNRLGEVTQETTIVRTGGATDGTTPISWNFAPSANSSYFQPFISEEITAWNDNSGASKTATMYLTSASTLNNNDVWLEIEYLSATGAPLGALVSTKMSILGTPAALTSDSSTWGGSLANKYKLQASFTPQMKGPVKARIYVAKPSVNIYVDPLLNIA